MHTLPTEKTLKHTLSNFYHVNKYKMTLTNYIISIHVYCQCKLNNSEVFVIDHISHVYIHIHIPTHKHIIYMHSYLYTLAHNLHAHKLFNTPCAVIILFIIVSQNYKQEKTLEVKRHVR